jgi:uncharacterized protein YjbJ (UPF0337 family)
MNDERQKDERTSAVHHSPFILHLFLIGTPLAHVQSSLTPEVPMGREDISAGQAKQIRGKANDVIGAVKGDVSQQLKGKAQVAVGKVQEKLGRKSK